MSIKQKIFHGVTLAMCVGGLYVYFQYLTDTQSKKIQRRLKNILNGMQKDFGNRTHEGVMSDVIFRPLRAQLYKLMSEFVQFKELNNQLQGNDYFLSLQCSNLQQEIFSLNLISIYFNSGQSIMEINQQLKQIHSQQVLLEQVRLDHDQTLNIFIFNCFLFLIQEFEKILLTRLGKKTYLVQINVYFNLLVDIVEGLLHQQPLYANILGKVLMSPINLSYDERYQFGHKCDDLYFYKGIKDLHSNTQCDCLIFDLLTRFSSLVIPTYENRFVTLLIKSQVFQTEEHLTQLGQVLMQNIAYLTCKINGNSMNYTAEVSLYNKLIIQVLIHPKIRERFITEFRVLLEIYLQTISHFCKECEFQSPMMYSFIQFYCGLSLIYDDSNCMQILSADKQVLKTHTQHFLGILYLIEIGKSYNLKKNDKEQLINWMTQNMDTLFINEVICYLQLQYIKIFLKYKQTHFSIGEQLLGGLELVLFQRNLVRANKNSEINVGFTKTVGYVIFGITDDQFITKQSLKNSFIKLPFKNKASRVSVFTDVLDYLFDTPYINLDLLRQIGPRCKLISQEAGKSYNEYFNCMQSTTTLSIDTYMVTLQICMLFGNPEMLFGEIKQKIISYLSQFDNTQDQLTRQLILLIDLMENPYYALNILTQQEKVKEIEDIAITLHQRAAIATIQQNPKLSISDLLEKLQSILYIKELPLHIYDIFQIGHDGLVQLKPEYVDKCQYVALQKNIENVRLYLAGCSNKYDELINVKLTFPYLRSLRKKLFKSQNFIGLFLVCLKNSNRQQIQVWLVKFLYYAKQHLLGGQSIQLVEKLFQVGSVKKFIEELSKEPNTVDVVTYLRG